MTIALAAEAPPIRRDADGILRIGDTRLLLDVVLCTYKSGATPEDLSRAYPSLSLADAYAVIAWYLHHREEVDAYLAERDAAADEIRRQVEAEQPELKGLRERLLARRRK